MNGGRTGGGRAQKKREAGNKEKIGHKSHCFYAVHPGLEDSILQQAQEEEEEGTDYSRVASCISN